MELNSIINIATNNTEVGYKLLKKSQDLASNQVSQLVQSMPSPPSPSGVGQLLDIKG